MRRAVGKGVALALLALVGCGTLMLPGFKDRTEQDHFFPESVSRTFPASTETTALAVERACAVAGMKELKLGFVFDYTKDDLKARRADLGRRTGGRHSLRLELDPEMLETHSGWLRGQTEQGMPVLIRYENAGKDTDKGKDKDKDKDQEIQVSVHVGDGKTVDRATAESLLAAIGRQLAEAPAALTPEERSNLIYRAKVELRPLQ